MPRRSVLTEAQRAALLALPENEADLVRYLTLSSDDLRVIVSRRRAHTLAFFQARTSQYISTGPPEGRCSFVLSSSSNTRMRIIKSMTRTGSPIR